MINYNSENTSTYSSTPWERHKKNIQRNNKEAILMKQYSEEFLLCESGEDEDKLLCKMLKKFGGITLNEFHKKQILWEGEYPNDVKLHEECTLQNFYTGEPIQLNIHNEYYTLLKKISKNNNIPVGEIELNIRHDTEYGNMNCSYLRFHPRYKLDIDQILKDLHAKIDKMGNDSLGYVEYQLIIQDKEFEKELYEGQKEFDNFEFDEKDYEWLWEETYEEHIQNINKNK